MSNKKVSKKKEKNKASSYREIKFDAPITIKACNGLIMCDGSMHRDDFISLTNKTFYQNMKSKDYITEDSNGFCTKTDKLEKDYSKQHGKTSFGGSGCNEGHKRASSLTATFVPESILLRGNFKNGTQMTQSHIAEAKTNDYKNKKEELKKLNSDRKSEIQENYKTAMANPSLSKNEKILIERNYKKDMDDINKREKVVNKKSRSVSPPDIQITGTKNELYETIDNLSEYKDTLSDRLRNYWEPVIEQMYEYVRTSTEVIIDLNLEYLTPNYKQEQVIAKQNWGYMHDTKVFCLKTD